MENNSKSFIVSIILLSVIVLLLVGYIVYEKINTKNISLEENQEVVENSNQTQTEETIKTVEVEKIVEVEKAKLFNIDLNNLEEGISTVSRECVYSMYGSQFTVYTDLSGNNPRATFFDSDSNSLIDIKVIGIDKKIIDVKMGATGQTGAEWAMYFLLEDGTVKVSNDVYMAKNSRTLEMKKNIELENKIVKLVNVSKYVAVLGIDETGKTIKL